MQVKECDICGEEFETVDGIMAESICEDCAEDQEDEDLDDDDDEDYQVI
jgi:hypothetical protein